MRRAKGHNSVNGCVQIGKTELRILDVREDGDIVYDVVAPVVEYWGLKPKKGAMWTLQSGITPHGIVELLERYNSYYKPASYGIFAFSGSRDRYPYEREV